MSRILVLSGSPRRNGSTDTLVGAFADGALSSGNTVDIIRVTDCRIAPCSGCNSCVRSADHHCCVRDDMDMIYDALMCHDTLVIASPLYFYSISAQLKAVIDRLHTPLRNEFSVRSTALLMTGAAELTDMFDAVLAQYELNRRYFRLTHTGSVLVGGIKETEMILSSPALRQAYEMGASIK